MDEDTAADQPIEQLAASPAMRVVIGRLAMDHEIVFAAGDAEPVTRDTGYRHERRTGDAPATRTMAVQGRFERVGDRTAHRAAEAFAGENASLRSC